MHIEKILPPKFLFFFVVLSSDVVVQIQIGDDIAAHKVIRFWTVENQSLGAHTNHPIYMHWVKLPEVGVNCIVTFNH